MRTTTSHRKSAVVVALAALALTGCAGYQTDPGVQRHVPSVSRQDIITKIGFVTQDQCYTRAAQHGTERCERYLAQVRNIALSATDSTENPPQITDPARTLEQRVTELSGRGCFPPQPGTEQECTRLLIAADGALDDLHAALVAAPPG
ncbi:MULTISPECIES: hypothetical protein [unclassified Saccharopolyspora]|uniref:hypothetical protein n=1 Tax=unclassified Saccharopolyspora TaxID=2646250 RepID=UPI001CD47A93|nr:MULTISPECIES: hypothetical protein [unclassified Saccharopolyspora]MCA1188021.1 hypothetical protein [Saccharopolyspora sp. 6T]MCA1194461.1 hypothetical protein [Saccharopolyspora sp. 6V]MCA1229333.1 hypothetical protein [Saccharopolyspora sp. 6M]MCA1282476.1 hypothetical protein [Saccharopolyspora sp. 7B]